MKIFIILYFATILLLAGVNNRKENMRYIEIYTQQDIYYIYPKLCKIETEMGHTYYFSNFEKLKEFISTKTAEDTAPTITHKL